MERDQLWKTIEARRLALADLLEGLRPEQWDAPSLCEGWRVRDVAAHVTLSTRARPLGALVGVARARGSFNRYVAADARARADRPTEVLVADLRTSAPSRHHPPGTKPEDPLVDVLVHIQDIALPLGIAVPTEPDAAIAAVERVLAMSFPFHARRRTADLRIVATDAPWAQGTGDEVRGPLAGILLALTGRRAGLDLLEGGGLATLASRLP